MFARTARLTLRPDWPEDAAALVAAIDHRAVATNLCHVPHPYRLDDAHEFLARRREDDDLFCFILAHGSAGARLIGGIGIHRAATGPRELGYWLTPEAWGRGYATEAGAAMLAAARHDDGMRRLQAGYFTDNPASGRVLAKLGFRKTGEVIEQSSIGRGGTVACVRMAADLTDRPAGDRPIAA